MSLCYRAHITVPVIPQGGATGLIAWEVTTDEVTSGPEINLYCSSSLRSSSSFVYREVGAGSRVFGLESQRPAMAARSEAVYCTVSLSRHRPELRQ